MARILSISGLRGTLGDDPGLDPGYIVRFASAIGSMTAQAATANGTQPVVYVARDGRPTGEMVEHAVIAGLVATGCEVVRLGIATTPTCGVVVSTADPATHTAMGLQITASHNPAEWNGLKPFNAGGSVLNKEEGQPLLDRLDSGTFDYVSHDRLGSVRTHPAGDVAAEHIRRVLALVDVDRIKAKPLTVALDCVNGSGAMHTPSFLRDSLGQTVHVVGGEAGQPFPHTPEPTATNLAGFIDQIREQGADIGFAQDPDADRLAVVCPELGYIGEEYTLALCADHVLSTRKGPLVVNGSTSRINADIAERHGCAFHRSHVGEANVTAMMKEVGATLGGEGNGGVIEPQVGYVRDSLVSMAYLLDGLAQRGGTLADWVRSLPAYAIVKDKVTCPADRVPAVVEALQKAYPDAEATTGDGLRLDWPDRWVQVRASNTEPIVRVIAEAPDEAAARELVDDAMGRIES